ncbi:ATP-dependent helicase [Blattabacterium sp. (Blaberus giganteus)]|uniref:ATP-dependent helicase n=1 Tax=Blattabacterium sp. (Blaberus giganteus) TaxID=1186051 RepID=UPI00025F6FEF|nr:UvrD-helicase domain-containing protein [Blattabacterium sp. (Blaberus giganteus)]AFJ90917.1 ATP-dependent DNA helicase [Blattabacterium sp. (Blaberus giganteus)]
MNSLNNSQRKIIEIIKGPILVIAGAGSGKTRVITHRIVHMIQNIGISPSNILALTFTKKAAKEMKDRISNMMMNQINFDQITLGTFHSIFSSILRKESHWLGLKSNYTIYDHKDSENIIKKILKDFETNLSLNYKEIRIKISQYKNNLYYFKNKFQNKKLDFFTKIYKSYIKRCFQANSLDFDDILLYTNHLFSYFPNVLEKYQKKFKYILIDEYQDTNLSQYTIIKNLVSQHKNLFVVGDDAQSIYSFRGANISNILNFHLDYKNAKIFRLEQNYRSTNHIVQASNNIISFNKNQIFKKIWTNNEKGEKIRIYCASSELEEAQYIASSILSIKKKTNLRYENFAILYRSNRQSHIIEYSLKKNNIPYNIYGSISLENRKEIRYFLAYLRIIVNPNDEESLLRIVKKVNQKIVKNILSLSKKIKGITVYKIIKNVENYQYLLKISNKTINRLKNLILTIEKLRINVEQDHAYTIAKNVENFLLKENYNHEDFQYILDHTFQYVQEQKKLKNNGDTSLFGFLRFFYLEINDDINHEENKNNKVSLMTVHLSKGLEFSIVFIVGLEENLFPLKSDFENQFKIEEERRLFYVALTRAQKKAVLTYAKYRFIWGKKKENVPSRFINELNKNFVENQKYISKKKEIHSLNHFNQENQNSRYLEIKKGVKVFHKNFGIGTIVELQNKNQIALIKFKQSGEKRILIKLDKLVIYS